MVSRSRGSMSESPPFPGPHSAPRGRDSSLGTPHQRSSAAIEPTEAIKRRAALLRTISNADVWPIYARMRAGSPVPLHPPQARSHRCRIPDISAPCLPPARRNYPRACADLKARTLNISLSALGGREGRGEVGETRVPSNGATHLTLPALPAGPSLSPRKRAERGKGWMRGVPKMCECPSAIIAVGARFAERAIDGKGG
jgi:hypothetical protein